MTATLLTSGNAKGKSAKGNLLSFLILFLVNLPVAQINWKGQSLTLFILKKTSLIDGGIFLTETIAAEYVTKLGLQKNRLGLYFQMIHVYSFNSKLCLVI